MKQGVYSFILLTITIFVIGVILWVSESYLEHRYDKRFINAMFDKRFIYLRNLSPNANPTFDSHDLQLVDSFKIDHHVYTCITDEQGFIVSKNRHPNPDLKFAFLGGSIPQSLYVDEENRMPEAVAKAVERSTSHKVNVWNAAAGGTNSYHSLNVLSNLVLKLQPDYAFFYANINDVATFAHYGTFDNPNPRWGKFFNVREYDRANKPSDPHPLPYIRQALLQGTRLNQLKDDFADVRDSLKVVDTLILKAGVKQVYKTMIAVCKANGIQPILITQVNLYHRLSYDWAINNMPLLTMTKLGYDNLIAAFEYYNTILREVANEEKVMLIDLPAGDFGFDDFYDPSHFNTAGYAKASRMIAEQFVNIPRSNLQIQ